MNRINLVLHGHSKARVDQLAAQPRGKCQDKKEYIYLFPAIKRDYNVSVSGYGFKHFFLQLQPCCHSMSVGTKSCSLARFILHTSSEPKVFQKIPNMMCWI